MDEIRFVEGTFGGGVERVDAAVFGEFGEEEGFGGDVTRGGDDGVGGWEAGEGAGVGCHGLLCVSVCCVMIDDGLWFGVRYQDFLKS